MSSFPLTRLFTTHHGFLGCLTPNTRAPKGFAQLFCCVLLTTCFIQLMLAGKRGSHSSLTPRQLLLLSSARQTFITSTCRCCKKKTQRRSRGTWENCQGRVPTPPPESDPRGPWDFQRAVICSCYRHGSNAPPLSATPLLPLLSLLLFGEKQGKVSKRRLLESVWMCTNLKVFIQPSGCMTDTSAKTVSGSDLAVPQSP